MIKEAEGTILHHNILSQKEQQVKSKIFTKGKNSAPKIIENNEKNLKVMEEHNEKFSNFQKNYESISEKQVEVFLKNMEEDFKKLSENKEVNIEMIQQQNLFFKQLTNTMEKNQENMIDFLEKKGSFSKNDISKENIIFFHEMLKPIKKELEGIQESYMHLKSLCSTLQNKTDKKKSLDQKEISEYHEKHINLKKKIQQAQTTLDSLLPQNIAMISNISQKTVEIFGRCIEDFKSKMETLQNDAEKAEKHLEKVYSRKLEKPAAQTHQSIVPLNVNVNFKASNDFIMSKLDGEFDYNRFLQYCEKKKSEFYSEISDLQKEFSEYQMTVPILPYSIKEIQSICAHPPSVLENIKKRMSFDDIKKNYLIKIQRPQSVQSQEKKEVILKKKINNRPKSIHYIATQPNSCPKDIKFEKKKEAFETIFETSKKKPNRIFEIEPRNNKYDQEAMLNKKLKNSKENREEKLKLEESLIEFKEERTLKDAAIQSNQKREECDNFLENFLFSHMQSSQKKFLQESKYNMQQTRIKQEPIKIDEISSEPVQTLNYEDLFTKNFEKSKRNHNDSSIDVDLNEIPFDIGLNCMKKDQHQKEVLQLGENLLKERLKIFAKNLTNENNIATNIFKLEEEKELKKSETKNIFFSSQSEKIDNQDFGKNFLQNQASLITSNVLELINTAIKTINHSVNQNAQNYVAQSLELKDHKPSEEQRTIRELKEIKEKNSDLENHSFPYNTQNFGNDYFQVAPTFDNFNLQNMPAFHPLLPADPLDMFKDFVLTENSEENDSSVHEPIAQKKKNKREYNWTNSSRSEGELSLNEISENSQIQKTPFRDYITNDKKLLTENIFEDVSHESEFSEGEIRIRNIFGDN